MIKALGILVITAVIMAIDVPPMVKKKQKKELWVFFIILIPGVIAGILLAFGVHLPNPTDFIAWLFRPVTNWIHYVLH